MILTIASQELSATSDLADSMAAAIARRRARAGRNVLLIYKTTVATDGWLATAIKSGAETREIPAMNIANELASAKMEYHDIVISMPQLEDAGSLYALATAELAVFAIQADQWRSDRNLISSIHAARTRNPELPVLLLIDNLQGTAGRAIMAALSAQIANVRFLHLSAKKRDEISVGALYQAIYAHCAAACQA
jgi:hypothetical protein